MANPLAGTTAPVFSPDRRFMAINSLDGEAVLWDRATGQKHLTARGTAVAFAPDSRSLAMAGSRRRDARGRSTSRRAANGGRRAWAGARGIDFAFSPDGKTIVAGQGGVLRFFDAATGRERLGNPEAHEGGVSIVRYHARRPHPPLGRR